MSVLLEGISSAVSYGLQQRVPQFIPGTVVAVAQDETSVDVAIDSDDDPGIGNDDSAGGVTSCSTWYPSSVRAGDRVMVMFYPPSGAAVVARLAGGYEEWNFVGEEDQPIFEPSWEQGSGNGIPFTDDHAYVSFRRIGRIVELRGSITRAVAGDSVAFYLPDGYRPMNRVVGLGLVSGGAIGYVVVRPLDGGVEIHALTGGGTIVSPTVLFLDAIRFSVDVFPVEE